jgi:phosphate transport system substrate-binding protein
MLSRRQALFFSLGALSLLFSACVPTPKNPGQSTNENPNKNLDPVVINGAGATFPSAIYLRWFAAYNQIDAQVQVNYQPVGSAAGVKQFINNTVDFAGSDTGLSDKEFSQVTKGAIAIPVTAGSIVLGYNLPNVKELRLSRQVYTDIFLGKITKWNDPAIAKINPQEKLPNLPIALIHRSDGSGTTEIFTSHLSAISAEWKTKVGAGKTVQWQAGTGTKGNEGITAQILQTPGAIGYIEYAYAKLNKISGALLENQSGKYIIPSLEATSKAIATIELDRNLLGFAPDPKESDAYPIASYSWILIYKQYEVPETSEALKKVLIWALTDGQKISEELGYVQLPPSVVTKAQAALEILGK